MTERPRLGDRVEGLAFIPAWAICGGSSAYKGSLPSPRLGKISIGQDPLITHSFIRSNKPVPRKLWQNRQETAVLKGLANPPPALGVVLKAPSGVMGNILYDSGCASSERGNWGAFRTNACRWLDLPAHGFAERRLTDSTTVAHALPLLLQDTRGLDAPTIQWASTIFGTLRQAATQHSLPHPFSPLEVSTCSPDVG